MEYKANFFQKHRNFIFLIIIFTTVFGLRLYYAYKELQPVMLPVLKVDVLDEGARIEQHMIGSKIFYKINLTDDMITNKEEISNMYSRGAIVSGQPISQKQLVSSKEKFRYLQELNENMRVIQLPSDISHTDIKKDDRIQITITIEHRTADGVESEVIEISKCAKVLNKIYSNAKTAIADGEQNGREGITKILMVGLNKEEKINYESYIHRGKVNISLLPPSYFENLETAKNNVK